MLRTLLFMLMVACVGCGPGNVRPPAPSDRDKAKQALTQALDAWRSGETSESLRKVQPAVIVSDEDWLRGEKLVSYALQGDGKKHGNSLRFLATLELRTANGSLQRKNALYHVGTEPVLTVVRSDELDK